MNMSYFVTDESNFFRFHRRPFSFTCLGDHDDFPAKRRSRSIERNGDMNGLLQERVIHINNNMVFFRQSISMSI